MKNWMQRGLILGTLVSAVALAGCGNGGGAKSADDASGGGECSSDLCGKAAPEVSGDSVMGDGPTTIAEGKGNSVVIVDFWATFCDPCRKSFPKYQELVDKYAGDLAVIAVSVDDPDDVGEDEVKKFAEELGVSFAIVWDKDKKTAEAYNPPKMPTSYIVDKEGVIRHVHAGFEGDEALVIEKEVDALLK